MENKKCSNCIHWIRGREKQSPRFGTCKENPIYSEFLEISYGHQISVRYREDFSCPNHNNVESKVFEIIAKFHPTYTSESSWEAAQVKIREAVKEISKLYEK